MWEAFVVALLAFFPLAAASQYLHNKLGSDLDV
jgi:hypothetical protein